MRAAWITGMCGLALAAAASAPAATVPGTNGRIVVHSGGLATVAPDGSGYAAVPNTAHGETPDWSPDGRRIAFSPYNGDYHLWVVNADGSGLHRVTTLSDGELTPSWSPDGAWLAYATEPNTIDYRIGVVRSDGTQAHLLPTPMNQSDTQPSWSPDGCRIVFRRSFSNDGMTSIEHIVVMNADGSNQVDLTPEHPDSGQDSDPSWSPDGSRIVYYRNDHQVTVMKPDGSDKTPLVGAFVGDINGATAKPRFSPDGRQIVYNDDPSGQNSFADAQLFTVPAAGGPRHQLTSLPNGAVEPSWQTVKATPRVRCGAAASGAPALGALHLSRRSFRAGRGTVVRYTDSIAATTTFSVYRVTRIRGSVRHHDRAGANAVRFTGRVGGRLLRPGRYRLRAVPRRNGKAGAARTTAFRIVH